MKYLQKFLFGCVILSSFTSLAFGSTPPSAHRDARRSYLEYLQPKVLSTHPQAVRSVEGVSRNFTEAKFKDYADSLDFRDHERASYKEAFQWVRDLRFLTVKNNPQFLRRITWQYPDDGCFARAELAARKLKENGFDGLKKIFVFGDLEADTPNAAEGFVTWWFHVAPMVKVDGDYMVLDPAIAPDRLITVRDWLKAMNRDYDSVQLSICNDGAYDPSSVCQQTHYLPEEEVLGHQNSFLHREWYRMKELGRDPQLVLGDFPPWGDVH